MTEPLAHQQIFDRVATHLLTQRKRAYNKGRCAYRGEDGLKCAVGCLIPDDLYDPAMEGRGITELFERFELEPAGLAQEHEVLLARLQHLHDDAILDDWKLELEEIAIMHRLNPQVLSHFPEEAT